MCRFSPCAALLSVCLAVAPVAAARPHLVANEPRFPARASSELLSDIVLTGMVQPRQSGKTTTVNWGRTQAAQQGIALRAVVDGLSIPRPPISVAAAILAIARIESGFNPGARNPNSTACGIFQFIKGTWERYGVSHAHCANPRVNALTGVLHLIDIYVRHVRPHIPSVAELPDPDQRAEWVYRRLYAYHYHGEQSALAAAGGSIDSQGPAASGAPRFHALRRVLQKHVSQPVTVIRSLRR
jgi:Transglycosylase SLT domain